MKQGHASGLIATHLPACFAPLLQRVRERQAEVAEERRALAAEKRAREEEARREAAARQAAGPALDFGGDLLMHAVSMANVPSFCRCRTDENGAARWDWLVCVGRSCF